MTRIIAIPTIASFALTLAACGGSSAQPETIPPEQELPPASAEPEPIEGPGAGPQTGPAEPPVEQPAAPTVRSSSEVSDAEVESFVKAYIDAAAVEQEYASKLQTAQNQDEAAQLQQSAQAQVEQAVEQRGMTLEEFQAIGNSINADAELRARVEQKLQEIGEQK